MKKIIPLVLVLIAAVSVTGCIIIRETPEPPPHFDFELEVHIDVMETEFGLIVGAYYELNEQFNEHIMELHGSEPIEMRDGMLVECPHPELGEPFPHVHLPDRVEFLRHRQDLFAGCIEMMYAHFGDHLEAFHEEPGVPMPEGFQPVPEHEAWELKVHLLEENMGWFNAAIEEMQRNFHGHLGGLH